MLRGGKKTSNNKVTSIDDLYDWNTSSSKSNKATSIDDLYEWDTTSSKNNKVTSIDDLYDWNTSSRKEEATKETWKQSISDTSRKLPSAVDMAAEPLLKGNKDFMGRPIDTMKSLSSMFGDPTLPEGIELPTTGIGTAINSIKSRFQTPKDTNKTVYQIFDNADRSDFSKLGYKPTQEQRSLNIIGETDTEYIYKEGDFTNRIPKVYVSERELTANEFKNLRDKVLGNEKIKQDKASLGSKFIDKTEDVLQRNLSTNITGYPAAPSERTTGSKVGDIAANIIGTGLSYFAPTGGTGPASSLGSATNKAAELITGKAPIKPLIGLSNRLEQSTIGRIGKMATEGAITTAPVSTFEAVQQDLSTGDAIKKVTTETALGAGFGGVLKGIGEGVPLLKTLAKSKINDTKTKDIAPNPVVNDVTASTVKPKSYKDLKIDELPDNQLELEKIFEELNQAQKSMIPIDLQLFAEVKKRLSKFKSNTVERTTLIPEDIKNRLDDSIFEYAPETSVEWQQAAVRNVNNDINKVIERIKSSESIAGGVEAHEGAVVTSVLVDKAKKTGDITQLQDWLKTITTKTRETARALKGTDTAWEKTSPEGALMQGQRVVDKVEEWIKKNNPKLSNKVKNETKQRIDYLSEMGEAFDPVEIENQIKKKYGVPTFGSEDIKSIIDTMENAKKLTGRQQQIEYAKVQQLIADKIPPTWIDKFKGMQRLLMLYNPKTVLTRNPLGNAILGFAETIKDIPASILDMAISKATGAERTTLMPDYLIGRKGQLKGAKQGLKEWLEDIRNGVDTSPSRGQVELPKGRTFDNPVLNALDQTERRVLQLGDRPFYQSAYESRMNELLKIKDTKEITEDMIEEAKRYALDRTFQNKSEISKALSKIKNASDNPIYQVFANLILPFSETPGNILDKLIDYSPGGLIKAVTQIGKTKSKGVDFDQKLFVDRVGRALTGTGIAILGYVMAQKGLISGKSNKDKDVAELERSMGKTPYSFKIGDKHYTFDWAQPISSQLAIGADAYFGGKDKNDFITSLSGSVQSAGDTFFRQSVLQGITNLFSGYSPSTGLANSLSNSTTQAVPTLSNQFAQYVDPIQRETYDPSTLKQIKNKLVAKIPYASKTLPPKVDTMGQEVKRYQGNNNIFNVFFNPGQLTEFKPNAVQKEVLRIYEASGEKNQFPRVAPKSITYKGEKIQLTPKEYAEYQKKIGQLTEEKFSKAMDSKVYRLYSDEAKAKKLESILTDVNEVAKKELLKSRGLMK